jgi:hypothetical protein
MFMVTSHERVLQDEGAEELSASSHGASSVPCGQLLYLIEKNEVIEKACTSGS